MDISEHKYSGTYTINDIMKTVTLYGNLKIFFLKMRIY